MAAPSACESRYETGEEMRASKARNGPALRSIARAAEMRKENAVSSTVIGESAAAVPSRKTSR